ncbi:uncharacterized protein involved in response to NO [Sinorhizobium fredii]|uniref:NnrS dehydrogenase NnrS n=1 Tax=Sinorhizobium fredii (strain USDA 257) TaxID=1185652 RepID=I3X987_SINF2|nr:NnrS family protein [Sinorhizobium fredii]AFL52443.1 NnrS dehydrogenase NnrS [Sinorhizobium fredii USDA 257]
MTTAVPLWKCLWEAPYRPLFLLAGLWALIVPIVWLLPDETSPERISWHSRELLFGMAGAAAGGYLLTALPAWTKRGPVPPVVSVVATCLWCAARVAAALPEHLPPAAAAIGASAYFVFLTAVLASGVVSSKSWSRSWAPLGTAVLAISALLLVANRPIPPNATPLLFMLLIVLIGGRAVPAFTRRWLDRIGAGQFFFDRPHLSWLSVSGIFAAIYLDGAGHHTSSGILLLFSAALLLLQMKGWQSLRTCRYPALFMLHVAFGWTPTALVLGGLSAIIPEQVPPAAATHALTMGAMGTMIAAFMMRSAMVRNGESLVINWTMACAFALISLSALLRVGGCWWSNVQFNPVAGAVICWMAGWAFFISAYFPALKRPVPRPVLSAAIATRSSLAAVTSKPLEVDIRGGPFVQANCVKQTPQGRKP